MTIKITHYTSSRYKGALPNCEIFVRNIFIAWGTIDDVEYTYATLGGPAEGRRGVVTTEFIEEAKVAFGRAAKERSLLDKAMGACEKILARDS